MASAASDDGSLDAPLAMGVDRDGDAVGERMMSMDELKQEMFKSLKDTGTIEAIRVRTQRRETSGRQWTVLTPVYCVVRWRL
jgi:hypothetical protein